MTQASSIWPAVAAIASAISAISCWSAGAYFRNLRRSKIDECLSAALDFQGNIGRSVTLRERKDLRHRNIDSQRIRDAYNASWSSWCKFKTALVIVRGCDRTLANLLSEEIPKRLSTLLLELERLFEEDEEWVESSNSHTRALEIVRDVGRVVEGLTVPLARPNA